MVNRNVAAVFSLLLIAIFLAGCKSEPDWSFSREIALPDIQPIGIVAEGETLWLSDAKNNRVVKIDLKGNILEEYSDIQRPMHISQNELTIYVPEYTIDSVKTIKNQQVSTFLLLEKPDAPAGIAVENNKAAIADFYNHRIIFQQNGQATSIGKEGHNQGDLYYPTDVAFYENKIYVADAYNNRIQVFDLQGNSLQIIGDGDKINVATGLEVSNDQVFVTDFEGNRILIYDLDGNLKQSLNNGSDKPSDLVLIGTLLYVVNYGNGSISVFEKSSGKK
jgi:DNA-binding beta-propeller fold protein YncE